MTKYILGIDSGTTSVRSFVIDEAGSVVGFGQQELTQHYPRAGWIEHDPKQILASQLEVMRAAQVALDAAGFDRPWGADGDHLKTPDDVTLVASAGWTFMNWAALVVLTLTAGMVLWYARVRPTLAAAHR